VRRAPPAKVAAVTERLIEHCRTMEEVRLCGVDEEYGVEVVSREGR